MLDVGDVCADLVVVAAFEERPEHQVISVAGEELDAIAQVRAIG